MFYHNLSGTLGQSILTSGDPDLALFPTLQSSVYWSGTESPRSDGAWGFVFEQGWSGVGDKVDDFYSWAVHAGNVVPVPAAAWLFGSGLLGLVGIARRKKAA
ncbi:MAG: VPLPA-CTERM sorting domain-containing protein [Thiogranum sp.]